MLIVTHQAMLHLACVHLQAHQLPSLHQAATSGSVMQQICSRATMPRILAGS